MILEVFSKIPNGFTNRARETSCIEKKKGRLENCETLNTGCYTLRMVLWVILTFLRTPYRFKIHTGKKKNFKPRKRRLREENMSLEVADVKGR